MKTRMDTTTRPERPRAGRGARTARRSALTLLGLALAAGCERELPLAPPAEEPERPARPLGVLEVTISGIGTQAMASAALSAPSVPELRRLRAERERRTGGGAGGVQLRSLEAPETGPGDGDGTIQLVPLSTGSFTAGERGAGGERYLHATFRVRNAQADGTPYGTERRNLTFLAVATGGTHGETAISSLFTFDGTEVTGAAEIARSVLPTGAVRQDGGGGVVSRFPDVLQALTDAEAEAVDAPEGVTHVLPYGFVASNPNDGASRTLPASPAADDFDGVVTFAFRLPLQTTPAEDPFTISALFLALDDAETRVTQSLEEQTTLEGHAAFQARAAALGATTVTLLPGGHFAGAAARVLCTVRTAGSAADPKAHLVAVEGLTLESLVAEPVDGGLIPRNARFVASFSGPVHANAGTFAVRGLQSGPAFRGEVYAGTGSSTVSTPPGSFFPGEEVEVSLLAGQGCGASAARVARYRVAGAPASADFSPDPDGQDAYDLGATVHAVAIGDVFGLGMIDLVVAAGGGNIYLLQGLGGGSFSSPELVLSVGTGEAIAIELVDLTGNGDLDLIVLNSDCNVYVAIGSGNGHFSDVQAFGAGCNPIAVAIADLNGNGHHDMVIANQGQDVRALMGNGDGTFEAGPLSSVGFEFGAPPTAVVDLALGDLNGNGIPDLVVADFRDRVVVMGGQGNGSFSYGPASTYPVSLPGDLGDGPTQVALADLNGNGILDIVVRTGPLLGGFDGHVSVLQGHGDGGFSWAQRVWTGRRPRPFALADLNGDGILDIVVASNVSGFASYLAVLVGNGDATFRVQPGPGLSAGSQFVAAGDLTGDGTTDLVVLTGSTVLVLRGNGDGTFPGRPALGAPDGPVGLAIGDLKGNGRPGIAIAPAFGNVWAAIVYARNADGTFEPRRDFGRRFGGGFTRSVGFADLNGDGTLDLVLATESDARIFFMPGRGDGTFVEPGWPDAGPQVANGRQFEFGDLNGNGILDMVTMDADTWSLTGVSSIAVWLGIGDGTFQPPHSYAVGSGAVRMAIGDLNGNGILDLVVANHDSHDVSVLLGIGDGTFQAHQTFAAGSGPASVAIGDLNGNGNADLVVANRDSDNVSVLLGNGNGTFQPHETFAVGSRPRSVALGDLNGDGFLDIAVANSNSDNVSVLLGSGNGTFQAQQTFAVGRGPVFIAIADMTGDGRLDLVVAERDDNRVTILVNRP